MGLTPGDFRPDGSWYVDETRAGRPVERSQLYQFIDSLVKLRRESRESPLEIGIRIARTNFLGAFPSLTLDWQEFPLWQDWPRTQTRSTAEETVKRAGFGPDGHWEGGAWTPGRDSRRVQPIESGKVSELIGKIAQ